MKKKKTSKRAAEKPLTHGCLLLSPRTSIRKVAITIKLQDCRLLISIRIKMVNLSSRSVIFGVFSVCSLKSRLAELGQDTLMSTTMSSLLQSIDDEQEQIRVSGKPGWIILWQDSHPLHPGRGAAQHKLVKLQIL